MFITRRWNYEQTIWNLCYRRSLGYYFCRRLRTLSVHGMDNNCYIIYLHAIRSLHGAELHTNEHDTCDYKPIHNPFTLF